MKLLICIDDTDNLESIGSGELLQIMGEEISGQGLGRAGFITRHQLYVHEDIPYTSHNSSMCCEFDIEERHYADILSFATEFIAANAAEGSDPGLCIVKRNQLAPENIHRLIAYGRKAKFEILNKGMAYELAGDLSEHIHLSEHGGTGQGVIGALAGCGLRLSGNDGRMKGKIYPENEGNIMTVDHICKRYPFDTVKEISGRRLEGSDRVKLGSELKGVFLDHQITLMVKPLENDIFMTCSKKELKAY